MQKIWQLWIPSRVLRMGSAILAAMLLCMPLSLWAAVPPVRLAWDANEEPDIAGYRVYFGTQPGTFTEMLDVGNSTQAAIEGLAPGRKYYFAVTAYNNVGLESGKSDGIEYGTAYEFARKAYTGLIGETAPAEGGSFRYATLPNGRTVGSLIYGGRRYAWKGSFDRDGRLVTTIKRPGQLPSLTLTLQLGPSGDGVTGTVEGDGSAIELSGDTTATQNVPQAGRYTAVITSETATEPTGYGYAILNVSKKGRLQLTGTLTDGRKIAAALQLDADGTAPLYLFRNPNIGTLVGRILFRETENVSDADAILTRMPRAGGSETLELRAARYTAPKPGNGKGPSVAGAESLAIELERPDAAPVAAALAGARSLTGQAADGTLFSVQLAEKAGLFTGRYQTTDGTRLPFAGVLYQKTDTRGFGRLQTSNGAVRLVAEES